MDSTSPSSQDDPRALPTGDANGTPVPDAVASPYAPATFKQYVEEKGLEKLSLIGLFVLAVFYTLYIAQDVVLPILLAVLLSMVLRPVVRALRRILIPEGLGAAIVVLALLGGLMAGIYLLTDPAADWLQRAPNTLQRVEAKLDALRASIEDAQRATEQIEEMAQASEGAPEEVVVRGPGLGEQLLGRAQKVLVNSLVMFVLLFFLLFQGPTLFARVIRSLEERGHRRVLFETGMRVQEEIATYLRTVAVINVCLGIATGTVMWLLGMPNPALWGAMAGTLNFIPYLGAIVTAGVIGIVALLSFDQWTAILLPPMAFLALTTLEGQFLTPIIVGRRLTLNPVTIFVAVIFWGWIWGIPGALLAVPILAATKIVCDQTDSLKLLGALLGAPPREDPRRSRRAAP